MFTSIVFQASLSSSNRITRTPLSHTWRKFQPYPLSLRLRYAR